MEGIKKNEKKILELEMSNNDDSECKSKCVVCWALINNILNFINFLLFLIFILKII